MADTLEKTALEDITERLRDVGCDREPFTPDHSKCVCRLTGEAAREIERLRTALGWFLNDLRFDVAVGGNPRVVEEMLANARALLSKRSET